ncbi:hypothetical protein MBGDF03_00732 [Thermoplasmatales archaeon SCGC AB-540-F20]|nr:hypothetical protein MBGDF03_00732 [Thermoplasmatales archaeon SCGC AB-540-F20]
MDDLKSVKNNFRESLNFTIPVYVRLFLNKIRLKSCGYKVLFEKNVAIMRHKKKRFYRIKYCFKRRSQNLPLQP